MLKQLKIMTDRCIQCVWFVKTGYKVGFLKLINKNKVSLKLFKNKQIKIKQF